MTLGKSVLTENVSMRVEAHVKSVCVIPAMSGSCRLYAKSAQWLDSLNSTLKLMVSHTTTFVKVSRVTFDATSTDTTCVFSEAREL